MNEARGWLQDPRRISDVSRPLAGSGGAGRTEREPPLRSNRKWVSVLAEGLPLVPQQNGSSPHSVGPGGVGPGGAGLGGAGKGGAGQGGEGLGGAGPGGAGLGGAGLGGATGRRQQGR